MSRIYLYLRRRLGKLAVLAAAGLIGALLALRPPAPALIFFDVGQGDAALLRTPAGRAVLIDGGPDQILLRRLGEFLPPSRRQLAAIIVSHPHADHITGLIEAIRRYEVAVLLYAPVADPPPLFVLLLETARQRHVSLRPISASARFEIEAGCRADLFNPAVLAVPADENNSLTTRLDCGGLTALLAGDSSERVESALLAAGWPLAASVLKASHHGSRTANSPAFLAAVAPQIFVISAGRDNRFGHPHPEVVERALAAGLLVRRTDQEGSILIRLPGTAAAFSLQK